MTNLNDALTLFAEYQFKYNLPKYARVTTARVGEFISYCKEDHVIHAEGVTSANIRKYLAKTPKRQQPGAWRSRYTAIKTFFNFLVFRGLLNPAANPMATTPVGESLTNKRMMTPLEFEKLLLVIPQTHQGNQDRLCALLLWFGYTLQRLNQLKIKDIPLFPAPVKEIAERLKQGRGHITEPALFITSTGDAQFLHGQKLNKRLQQYAAMADLNEPNRMSGSLLFQSGNFHRLSGPQEEQ